MSLDPQFQPQASIPSQKLSDAYRTIGEVSTLLNVPTHVLRFWETRFTNISPTKRRGRRYYTPNDIALLTRIKHLLYIDKLTIEGAQKQLNQSATPVCISTPAAIPVEAIRSMLNTLVSARNRLVHTLNETPEV